MKRLYKYLLLFAAPILVMLFRVVFVLTRSTLYGFDSFSHLYFVKNWIAEGGWPLLNNYATTLPNDYNAWPGAHIFVGALSILTGINPVYLMEGLPTIFMGIMDLAIVLACVKWTGPYFAMALGLLFGSADQIFVQSQWYVPELLGLVLASFLVLNEFNVRSPLISYFLLMTLLMVHHFSFLLTFLIWVMICRDIFTRASLVVFFVVLAETLIFWSCAAYDTGSFPDISTKSGGIPPAITMILLGLALLAVRAFSERLYERYFKAHAHEPLEKGISALFGKFGRFVVPLVVGILLFGVLGAYALSVKRFDGLGFQPSKVLVFLGVLLFLWNAPFRRVSMRITITFVVIFLMFMLNPILFKFLPLMTRFLDFLYFLGFFLLALGAYYYAIRTPRNAKVILVALLLMVPVLMIDDGLRYNSDSAKRFELTKDDVIFAQGLNNHTEAESIIVGPSCLGGLIFGIGERPIYDVPSSDAAKAGNYTAALPYLKDYATKGPTYLVHSSRRLNYMASESDVITDKQMASLTASLSSPQLKQNLTLVYEHGDEQLYKFSIS